jgi:hypothetical protein
MKCQEMNAVLKQIHLKGIAEYLRSTNTKNRRQNDCEGQILSKPIVPIILYEWLLLQWL